MTQVAKRSFAQRLARGIRAASRALIGALQRRGAVIEPAGDPAAETAWLRERLAVMEQDRRRLEEESSDRVWQLARANAELTAMRESALDCIIVMDDRGRITEFNRTAEVTFGRRREDVIGKDLATTIIPPSLARLHAAGLDQYLKTGNGPALNQRIEVSAMRADGSEFPVELAVAPFFLDGRSTFVAYLRDITDRRRAEDASRHASKLALVASRTDNAVIITDVEGRIEWVNEGFTRVSGYRLDEVRGRKPGSFLQGPETDPATVAHIRSQLAKGEGFKVEIVNYGKNGKPYWLAIEAQPVHDDQGWLSQFMAIESDVSTRKQTEEALRQSEAKARENEAMARASEVKARENEAAAEAANRAKSEFLANMSHEIRTPLNGVIGMTELLLSTELSGSQRKFAQTARSSASALLSVINQVLDFSKIEAGKLELESIDFNPRIVVEEVAEMLAHKASAKGLELAHVVAMDVPCQVRGDPDRVRQVLINLINNAIKFTERGDVVVRVSRAQDNGPETPTLKFSVADTGMGVPADRLGRLFKSFSQVDASTTRRFGGTGLGLAICKQLVEIMGGQVGVESEAGLGSTFWFTVKFAPAAGQHADLAPPCHARDLPSLRGLRVLAVDDNASCRQVLAENLAAWGMLVETAADETQALQKLADAGEAAVAFQLVLLDMVLPGATGADLARAIQEKCRSGGGTAQRSPALVLMAGADNPLDAAQIKGAGFSGCVYKPIRPSQLFDEMVRVLSAGGAALPSVAPATQVGDGGIPSPPRAQEVLILLAEDNDVNRMVAVEILARVGYRCDVVADGRAAVEAAFKRRYDLVLMDCQMPVMDGFEATREIRRREPHGNRVPIIALTANAVKGDREHCLEAGMDDYLSKPLNPRHMVERIEAALAASGRREAPVPPAPRAAPAESRDVVPPERVITALAPPAAPFDVEDLLGRCLGDPSFLETILIAFRDRAGAMLQQLQEALVAHDAKVVARVAHGIKGAAANLSASAVRDLAAELEDLGNLGSLGAAEQYHEELRVRLQECIDYIPRAVSDATAAAKME